MSNDEDSVPGLKRDSSSRPRKPRRNPRLSVLRPAMARAGRAAAGVESARKKKLSYRARVVAAVAQLEKADPSRRPDLAAVARLSGVSLSTVRRHCEENPEFAKRILFARLLKLPKTSSDKNSDEVGKLKLVILSLDAKIEALESENRALRETNANYERRRRQDLEML